MLGAVTLYTWPLITDLAHLFPDNPDPHLGHALRLPDPPHAAHRPPAGRRFLSRGAEPHVHRASPGSGPVRGTGARAHREPDPRAQCDAPAVLGALGLGDVRRRGPA